MAAMRRESSGWIAASIIIVFRARKRYAEIRGGHAYFRQFVPPFLYLSPANKITMQPEIFLIVVPAVAVTALSTWYLTRRFISGHFETTKELDFEKKRNALIKETTITAFEGADFAARLDNAYREGKDDGQKAELQKFAIVYEPFQEVTEEYLGLKKRVEIGYTMQLHYAGLPIGQPTRKATHSNVEFDAAKIEKLVNSELMGSLNSLCQLIGSKGMSGKILPRKVS